MPTGRVLPLAMLALTLACHRDPPPDRPESMPESAGGTPVPLEATPTPREVASTLVAVGPAVLSCLAPDGCVIVAVQFASEGHVQESEVRGDPTGGSCGGRVHPEPTPVVRDCVARAVEGAAVRPFSNATFRVNYPYHRPVQ